MKDAFTARIMADTTKAHSFMVAGIGENGRKAWTNVIL